MRNENECDKLTNYELKLGHTLDDLINFSAYLLERQSIFHVKQINMLGILDDPLRNNTKGNNIISRPNHLVKAARTHRSEDFGASGNVANSVQQHNSLQHSLTDNQDFLHLQQSRDPYFINHMKTGHQPHSKFTAGDVRKNATCELLRQFSRATFCYFSCRLRCCGVMNDIIKLTHAMDLCPSHKHWYGQVL